MKSYLLITYWHWWGLAGLLVIGELLAPCYYFIAWGMAAGLTGLLVRLMPDLPGLWQLGIFALLSASSLLLAYHLKHRRNPSAPSTDQGSTPE